MKKFINIIFCLSLITLVTTGCKAKEYTEQSFPSENVEQIIIHTDGQNIELSPSEEEDVKISMTAKDKWTAVLEGGSLKVDIASSSDILNFTTPTLYVEVPAKIYNTIDLVTTSGNIKVDNVQTSELSVESDSGNISIKDLEGSVDAKTNSGKIKSALSISSAIIPKDAGYSLNGIIGEGKEEPSNIKLNSVSGTITIN